ncbi:MAG: hypothetical protein PHX63_07320 [Eubacteriales bacterium]|nr:hypothetical protein [Eubacteriales bacterium]
MKNDRVKEYFKPLLEEYVFDHFTDDFLEKLGAKACMSGVPVPISMASFGDFKKGGVRTIDIMQAVAVVLGCDTEFRYKDNYIDFLNTVFRGKTEDILVNEGYSTMSRGDFLRGAAYFRANLLIYPESMHSIYGYALACRALYLAGGTEEFVGKFKAESIKGFEVLNDLYPDFAFAYYYLGYTYLNMGLYIKAQLAWIKFLEKLENDDAAPDATQEKAEIVQRLEELKNPVEIEKGINSVSSGKYIDGMQALEKHKDGEHGDWWPMHYYLGIAYECVGMVDEAIQAFKRVLSIHPSHIDSMDELVAIYHLQGDSENEKKYSQKIQRVKSE